ncbi:hypothetical protein MJO28_003441, partial [Puccinia striiformis f. sp. tritici]
SGTLYKSNRAHSFVIGSLHPFHPVNRGRSLTSIERQHTKMISDTTLMSISNTLGVLSVFFIIIYQFFEVNARRTVELGRARYASRKELVG